MAYLNQAAAALTAAMEKEKEGELSGAIRGYRTAVDILITGVQGERMRHRIKIYSCPAQLVSKHPSCHARSCVKDEPTRLL